MDIQQAPALILRQGSDTIECRSVGHAAMLMDVKCRNVGVGDLHEHAQALASGLAMPVGSVEYVSAALKACGREVPAWNCYPECLRWALHREVVKRKAGSVLGRVFVKPVETKRFNGFVFDTMVDPAMLDAHDQEAHAGFMAVGATEEVWTSEPVSFVSEWRYYVWRGEVAGRGRYDPEGAEEAAEPSEEVIERAVACLRSAAGQGVTCAMDFGVMGGGETALVEVNDAFGLGLYSKAISNQAYLGMLYTRWLQLIGGGHTESGLGRSGKG